MLFARSWTIVPALLLSLHLVTGQNKQEISFSKTKNSRRFHENEIPRIRNEPLVLPNHYTTSSTPQPTMYLLPCRSTVLNFTGTGLRKIGDHFVKHSDAKELYLDHNDITEISAGAFDSLTELKTLSMSGNNFTIEKLLWFKEHKMLQKLVIDDNRYKGKDTSISDIHQSLPNLQYLSLRRNRITEFNVAIKDLAPRLIDLSLSGNNITSVDFIDDLPESISYLYLDDNAITRPSRKILSNLKVLSVSWNKIAELSVDSWSLEGMAKLSTLNVSRNRISTISENAFADTKRLSILDLSGNRIRNVSENTFNGLMLLKVLRMSHNMLTSIPKVCSLVNVKHLDLSHNHIAEVTMECIYTLRYLETLELANNYILDIDANTFAYMQALKRLDLSNNHINQLPVTLIQNLRSLQVLLLKNNSITNIDKVYTVSSRMLDLHLQDNPFLSMKISYLTMHVKEQEPLAEDEDLIVCPTKQNESKDTENEWSWG